jgi:chromatin remodeling complex protein RSC6
MTKNSKQPPASTPSKVTKSKNVKRNKKSKETAKVSDPDPVSVETVSATPVSKSKSSIVQTASNVASKSSKSSKTSVASNTSVVAESSVVPTLSDSFTELLGQLCSLRSQLTTLTGNVRTLQKRADKELKTALKSAKKRKNNGPRAPSGFVKPTKISLELAKFLGKPMGTEMARTEVTREINGYIREHKLQDPVNGRKILADDKLRKLLRLEKTDELTYFNLQKFMSPHFEKKGSNIIEAGVSN